MKLPGLLLLAAACLTPMLPGCGGCSADPRSDKARDKEQEAKATEKKKERRKPDFEPGRIAMLPGDDNVAGEAAKPGHWHFAIQRIKANNFDFSGQLRATCLDQQGRPMRLESSPYAVQFTRPVTLPTGQAKQFQLLFYVPRHGTRSLLESQLTTRDGNRPVAVLAEPVTRLEPHQYLLVVLAGLPDSYGYLRRQELMPSISPPRDELSWIPLGSDYIVLLPAPGKPSPLPANPLAWTSVAYVIWDDYDPDLLSTAQQAALIDWLHWGGQLIVSGPGSLERLHGGFLGEFLPARAGATIPVGRQILDQLDQHWYIEDQTPVGSPGDQPSAFPRDRDRPSEMVAMQKHPLAQFVPRTGQLLVERRVGRGRIVVSAFSLTDRQFVGSKRFDELFNACILRRGPRTFYRGENDSLVTRWHDDGSQAPDARRISSLRWFSRDARRTTVAEDSRPGPQALAAGGLFALSGFRSDPQSGAAGWNDFSGVADAARDSLARAAGIDVPGASFVFWTLAAYLVCLVPLNWAVFRLIGRVEWAWAAAPVIAIVGTVAVVRLAQLDIGFVRNRTEIAVVETQTGRTRAHVTRYSGLYASLSTSYRLRFEDDTALALPFSINPSAARLRLQSPGTVSLQRDRQVQLTGLRVMSNSTGMVHSEQMYTLTGPLRCPSPGGKATEWLTTPNSDCVAWGLSAGQWAETWSLRRSDSWTPGPPSGFSFAGLRTWPNCADYGMPI